MNGRALGSLDQVDSASQVAPLVRAAGLQHTVVVEVELTEVEALQDLVAELCVADALIGVQPGAHGILLQHGADPVVLTDLTKEIDGTHGLGPVEIVDDLRRVRTIKTQELTDLGGEVPHPLGNRLAGVERAFRRGPRIADQARRSAHEPERPVAGKLQPSHKQKLCQIAEVKAWRRGIEATVVGDRFAAKQRPQLVNIG